MHITLQPSDSHLPSSASIELPQVHVEAEYIQDDATNPEQHSGIFSSQSFVKNSNNI